MLSARALIAIIAAGFDYTLSRMLFSFLESGDCCYFGLFSRFHQIKALQKVKALPLFSFFKAWFDMVLQLETTAASDLGLASVRLG